MTIAVGSLWYNHLYNLTGCLTEAIWHEKWTVCWLRWALCVCVTLCTDWPVWGEGGPVSSRRRLCTTVCQPLGLWSACTQTHTHTVFFCLFSNKYTMYNILLWSLCVCSSYKDLTSSGLCLCGPACSTLSPVFVWFMYLLISSFTGVLTHLW